MHSMVYAFYKFVRLPDYKELKVHLQNCCEQAGLMGTILLAEEGINGTVSGDNEGLQHLWDFLKRDARLSDMQPKVSDSNAVTFYRMKVRLKKEIVTLGVPGVNPTQQVGTYIEPEDWNRFIRDPDVMVIDTRNDYEVSTGVFQGAIIPHTKSFREFPGFVQKNLDPEKNKKVALYCTGGIRCEKATSYLLQQGFQEVFHLKGGILNYLEKVPAENSLWEGECFIFDKRVTVNHELRQGSFEMCHACRHPLREEELKSPDYEPGTSCPYCIQNTSEEQKLHYREREIQMQLAAGRNENHLGRKYFR